MYGETYILAADTIVWYNEFFMTVLSFNVVLDQKK